VTAVSDTHGTDTRQRFPADNLARFTREALCALGVPEDQATTTAEVLVDSSLRGIDSHGVEKLVMYLGLLERGALQPAPTISQEARTGPTARIDAGLGLGFVPSVLAADLAIEKAREFGVGAVAVRSSGHFGAGGYYVRRIAEAGLVGFISTNARPLMPAPGGTAALVGNNPFAFGAPRADGPPFVFDMACSVGAFSKVRRADAAGEPVPADWGLDHDGEPTDDPAVILDTGLLAPVGGYKGFNLALMMEMLSAALCGAAMGADAGSVGEPDTHGCGHFVLALDPGTFGGHGFEDAVTAWFGWMRELTPHMRIPGEAGEHLMQERLAEGIPLPAAVVERFEEAARGFDPDAREVLHA
jgi:LDH2 family malate/lactate/ureidoglycolate dehydrogenase